MYEERFMRRALELSAAALTMTGTQPFGAVVVLDGRIVGEGLNHALAHHDPTSHGEVEAIRDACRTLGTVDLAGADLYTSCEPCALCVAAMVLAGIGQLYYAASLDQSAATLDGVGEAHRRRIDIRHLRAEAGAAVDGRKMRAIQVLDAEAVAILQRWAAAKVAV